MFLPQSIAFLSAVAAPCAFVFGAPRLGAILGGPAVWHWIVGPVVTSAFAQAPFAVRALVIFMLIIALPFLAIRLLQRAVNLGYGEHAGGHLAGTYLVRLLDALAGGLVLVLALPFRLLGRLLSRRSR